MDGSRDADESMSHKRWMIIDWAYNLPFGNIDFPDFDSAEEYLVEFLESKGLELDGPEGYLQEYSIVCGGCVRNSKYLDPKDHRSGQLKASGEI